ncbi:MAG: 30S ribosome-binding factor RbfA [Gammaproteobacteria bacterium]|jgi:ribosome-binding factor A|nr:30S ribosome-binding factor RbfA [Gammaproteobacteria bacterium]
MPREFLRSDRMAEQLRRELAEIVRDEIKDPRLGFVSFTEVRMSRDLSHAVIYCSLLNSEKQQEAIDVLNRAVGFIRKEIGRRIRARIVPTLKFTIDESVERGVEMDDLISKAISRDKKNSIDEESE